MSKYQDYAEYDKLLKASIEYSLTFSKAKKAHRKGTITDAEMLAVRTQYAAMTDAVNKARDAMGA